MQGDFYICDSKATHKNFIQHSERLQEEHKYITYTWRIGADRSIDQNKLVHIWFGEYAAHLLNKNVKSVTRGEIEGMKRHCKKKFYAETRHPWLVIVRIDPKSGETARDFDSTRAYKVGEMYEFMTWLQGQAAFDGLALESKGDFAKRQRNDK